MRSLTSESQISVVATAWPTALAPSPSSIALAPSLSPQPLAPSRLPTAIAPSHLPAAVAPSRLIIHAIYIHAFASISVAGSIHRNRCTLGKANMVMYSSASHLVYDRVQYPLRLAFLWKYKTWFLSSLHTTVDKYCNSLIRSQVLSTT